MHSVSRSAGRFCHPTGQLARPFDLIGLYACHLIMDCQSPNIGWAGLVASESANLMSKPGVMDKQPPGKRLSGAEKNLNHEKWKPPDALQ